MSIASRLLIRVRHFLVENFGELELRRRATVTFAVLLGTVLLGLSAPGVLATSTTYTLDAGFDQGTLDGVNHDAPSADQLQLDSSGSTFPLMWIANAGEDSVSRIDTDTDCETARYETWFRGAHLGNAFVGPAPSRTAVDGDGNVYVLNRHFDNRPASVVKILADGGIDRNGNGVIDTSTDDGDCQIDRNDVQEVIRLVDTNNNGFVDEDELVDERVAWLVQVGPNGGVGRALCLDPTGGLWVGLFNREEYYRVDSQTGAILDGPINVGPINPYGCLVDGNGFLWSADRGAGGAGAGRKIGKLDTAASPPEFLGFFNHGVGTHYSLALNRGNDKVFLALENAGAYLEFDIANETFTSRSATTSRGISTDGSGNIFVGRNIIEKHAPNGDLLWSAQNPAGFQDQRGVIVDANNDVWVVNKNASSVSKFDGDDGLFITTLPVGNQPYTYSDATGFAFRNITDPTGIWRVTRDSGVAGTVWEDVRWNEEPEGDVPPGTELKVEARAGEDALALANAPFQEMGNGAGAVGLSGRLLEIRVTFSPNVADGTSPILSDLTVVTQSDVTFCDVNEDGVVDRSDIRLVAASRNQSVTGPDSRDPDGNGVINANDARQCVLMCDLSRCAPAKLVPILIGLSQNEAQALLTTAGLLLGAVSTQTSDTIPVGTIIDQAPLGEAVVAAGAAIDVVVSIGPQPIIVPDVVGSSESAARAVIEGADLSVGNVSLRKDDIVPEGDVIEQTPVAGAEAAPGDPVDLVISDGPAAIVTPDVTGEPRASAEAILLGAGLQIGAISEAFSELFAAGEVVSQDPPAGFSVAPGSEIALVISLGPAPVAVPGIVGLTQVAGEASLVAAQLTLGSVELESSETIPAGQIITQDPAEGALVDVGSAVNIVVSSGPAPVAVPNVVNLSRGAAETEIANAGLSLGAISNATSETVPAGSVVSQDPSAGALVAPGSSVALTISDGPAPIAVPVLLNLTQNEAQAEVTGAGFVVGPVTQAFSATVPLGRVISQTPPAGALQVPGSAIAFVLSLGPQPVAVPNVLGFASADAEAAISGVGLALGAVTSRTDASVPAGAVIEQDPAPGAMRLPGTEVDLVVSLGPAPVTVPNVVGQTEVGAAALLNGADLEVGATTLENSDTVPSGAVISQSPEAGVEVAPGSQVDLVISAGVATVSVPNVVGLPQSAAQSSITGAGLTVGAVTTANSASVPAGNVISQDPSPAADAPLGSAVDLVVSLGPALVSVPNVVGLSQASAESVIVTAGLAVGAITTQSSSSVAAGEVIEQDPVSGVDVLPDTEVALVVSSGPPAVLDTLAPKLSASFNRDPPVYGVGEAVVLQILAVDDSVTPTLELEVDGNTIAVSLPNTSIDTSSFAPGSEHVVRLTARDQANNETSIELSFTMLEANDGAAPVVAIDTPVRDTRITDRVEIIGTASDPKLIGYELAYSPVGKGEFVDFASGDMSVSSAVLGELDAAALLNGIYDIRLRAYDSGGNINEVTTVYIIGGERKVGNFSLSFVDLSMPVAGIPITVTRTYDSRNKSEGDFGVGWDLRIAQGQYQNNREPGEGWQITAGGGFVPLPCQQVQETLSHITEVKLSEAEIYRFKLGLVNPAAVIGAVLRQHDSSRWRETSRLDSTFSETPACSSLTAATKSSMMALSKPSSRERCD